MVFSGNRRRKETENNLSVNAKRDENDNNATTRKTKACALGPDNG